MFDKCKWTILVSALVMACASGCSNDDSSGGFFQPEQDLTGSAKAECKSQDTCTNAGDQCTSEADEQACHYAKNDDGICGKTPESDKRSEICKANGHKIQGGSTIVTDPTKCETLAACADKAASSSLNPNEDDDCDGIINSADKYPCDPDHDKDGIIDGLEDLNHNGIYEEELGETSFEDPDNDGKNEMLKEAAAQREAVCSYNVMNGGGKDGFYNSFHVAQMTVNGESWSDSKSNDGKLASVLDDSNNKVAAFFVTSDLKVSGDTLLESAFKTNDLVKSKIGEGASQATVPSDSWKDNKVFDEQLNVLPKHTVDSYHYKVTLNDGVTIGAVRDALMKQFVKDEERNSTASSITCQSGTARVYVSRAIYKRDQGFANDVILFSVGVACDDDFSSKTSSTAIRMEDVSSGTLVAPDKLNGKNFISYSKFVCQTEKFGAATGAVDFVWVVDNSGSMADEQENLGKTFEAFVKTLASSGIDYRIAISTTDAYLLDEFPEGYKAEDIISPSNGNTYGSTSFLEPTGVILESGKSRKGFTAASEIDVKKVVDRMTFAGDCKTAVTEKYRNANICGFGLEDGLKSGLLLLDRMTHAYEDSLYLKDLKKRQLIYNWACGKGFENEVEEIVNGGNPKGCDANSAKPECCLGSAELGRISFRPDALKYFVFVSDEETRQLKEYLSVVKDDSSELPIVETYGSTTRLKDVCRTGWKLSSEEGSASDIVYKMMMGVIVDPKDTTLCNPAIKTVEFKKDKPEEQAKYLPSEDAHPDEIKAKSDALKKYRNSDIGYYETLMYYVQQYQKFAGTGGIAAYAIVGDNGFSCQELPDDASATDGANYGLGYILFANMLSRILPEDNKMPIPPDDKRNAGGHASICNTSYQNTVDLITEDVNGLVAGSHYLKGFPISSTIHVAINNKATGEARVLTRNASDFGWQYNAASNSIRFSFSKSNDRPDANEYITVSYIIWSLSEG